MRKLLTAIAIVVLLQPATSFSENFDFKPKMSVRLGKTWNPLRPVDKAGSSICLNAVISTEVPIATEDYSESFVDSFQELQQKTDLSLSATGSYSYGIAKTSMAASYDSIREALKDERSIVYVLSGRRTYTPQSVESISLNATGEKLLAEANAKKSPTAFYKTCGEAVVTSIVKQTNISLVYVFKTSNALLKTQVRNAISLAAKGGGNRLDVAYKLTDEALKVDNSLKTDLTIFQSGIVDKGSSIRDVVGTEPGDIQSIRSALKKIVIGISWEQAAIASFAASPLSDYFDIPSVPNWENIQQAYVSVDSMRDSSERMVKRYFQLKDVLTDAENSNVVIKPGARDQIISELTNIENALARLLEKAKKCFQNKAAMCNSSYYDSPIGVMNFFDLDFGEFVGWRGTGGGSYEYSPEQVVQTATYWPEITLKNTRYVNHIDILKGDTVVAHINKAQLSNNMAFGVLTMKSIFSQRHEERSYCSNAHNNRVGVCVPKAGDKIAALNELKNRDSSEYTVRITDIEGGRRIIKITPLALASFTSSID